MPLYLTQFTYTPEAWAALSQLDEQLGGRLVTRYYAFGKDAGVIISEAPDEGSAAAVILAAVGAGHANAVQTVPLCTARQAVEAMRKPGADRQSVGYRQILNANR